MEFGRHFLPLQWLPQMCFQPLCCMGFHFLSHRCGLPTTVDQSEPIPFKYTVETKIPALVWNVCRECEQPGSGKTREEWRTQEAVNEMQKALPDSAAPAPLGHGTAPSLPIPLRPYAPCPSVTHSFYICSRALQCLQCRVIHKSISSLTKAIIRQDWESEGHRQKSANKPGWSMKRGGTTGMETRKLWASVWIKVLFTLGKWWEELGV